MALDPHAVTSILRTRPRWRRKPRRRGIVILVVISVLVLFMLMLVAFAVVSGHYRDSARAFAFRKEVTVKVSDSKLVLDDVLNMILGEPSSSSSVLWGHSLLSDLYGESINGVVMPPGSASEGNRTFVSFAAGRDAQQKFPYVLFSNTEQHYVGCVLTMKDGPCAGLSTRITHYLPGNPASIDNPTIIDPVNNPGSAATAGVPIEAISATHLVGASGLVAIRVEAFENGALPEPGNRFVVNGKPFSGTGVGRPYPGDKNLPARLLDVSTGAKWYANDEVDFAGRQWALMPNLSRWSDRVAALRSLYGGANEPWDTFDFQNMFLALTPTDPAGINRNMPSYHRPDLMAYWAGRVGTAMNPYLLYTDPNNAALLRQICMRPLPIDHPGSGTSTAFTGSNPFTYLLTMPAPPTTPGFYSIFSNEVRLNAPNIFAAAMANQLYRDAGGNITDQQSSGMTQNTPINCWDVDNDNDGVMDSIWIDAGLPIATGPDGRQYKPLVAVLIRDQDGRVNINASGGPEWAKAIARPETTVSGPLAGGDFGGMPVNLPRGQGVGAAEIQLMNMFLEDSNGNMMVDPAEVATALARYQQLMQGTPRLPPSGFPVIAEAVAGKYALDEFSPAAANPPVNRRPGAPGPNVPMPGGYSSDPLSIIKTQGFGLGYGGPVFSNYATPSDVWGRGAIALDYAGQPFPYNLAVVTDWGGMGTTVEVNDNPYEINLVDNVSSNDTPYTVAELETMLRRSDPDTMALPHRLFDNVNYFTAGAQRRMSNLTTLGMHIRGSRGGIPGYMRYNDTVRASYTREVGPPASPAYLPFGSSILDVCRARIEAEINAQAPMTPPSESDRQFILKQTMPFELFRGEPFNLNRPFGNGVDDNGNGVVDEPGETDNNNPMGMEPAWTAGPLAMTPAAGGAAYPLNDAHSPDKNWWMPTPNNAPYSNVGYTNFLDSDPHLYARQLYARNLYCLLLLLCDPNYYQLQPLTDGSPNAVTDPVQLHRLFCRRMAQYAVNAVDFRDPDAIMTPFEFDEYPFDGWHVDGNLATDENNLAGTTVRGVVWGMEPQDLVLKEAISFHNRKVRDTNIDTNMMDRMGGDTDVDQLGMPQGSTFIELYCPRSRVINNPKLPVELYDPITGLLDVGRMAPVSPPPAAGGDGQEHPVWQIAISAPMNPDPPIPNPNNDHRPNTAIVRYPDTFSLEPTLNPSLAAPTIQTNILDPAKTITIQRYVWMADQSPTPATGQQDNTFRAESVVGVQPGQYLVIVPRPVTYLGSVTNPSTVYWTAYSNQKIDVADPMSGFTIRRTDNTLSSKAAGSQIQAVTYLIASADPPRAGKMLADGTSVGMGGWAAMGAPRIGLNVTEPLPQSDIYYPRPAPATPNEMYDDPGSPMNTLPDQPFDTTVSGMELSTPSIAGDMFKTQTYLRSHTFVLQRLANPLQGFHPVLNPYINLDWAENDTTVFTGDENTDRQVTVSGTDEDVDPDDPSSTTGPRGPIHFGTRQRGNTITSLPAGMIWNPQTTDPAQTMTVGTTPGVYFDYNLVHTLGFVNATYDASGAATGGIARPLAIPPDPMAPMPGDPDVPPPYVGDPSVPFPWIAWNNRPYANPLELLQVPTSSPQQIGYEFAFNEVDDAYQQLVIPPANGDRYRGYFRHLLNFFLTTKFPGLESGNEQAPINHAADLYQLFDHVETPSPFVGTERWYRPDVTSGGVFGFNYRAPHNHLARFRDPGRININTVVDPLVWDAIVATFPELQSSASWTRTQPPPPLGSTVDLAPVFYQMLQLRRGYSAGAESNTTLDMFRGHTGYPSIVSNPIRPAEAFDLMPLNDMKLKRPVDATLLRGVTPVLSPTVPTAAGYGPTSPYPILDLNKYNSTNGVQNLHRATDRNSHFRYQPFAKLSNMLSRTSNTFAVWLTVGYFEVTPNTPNPPLTAGGIDLAHPDGYQLGQEMTFDGVVRRPRAFFLIDRSIPVGYEPGETHNINNCVLQRRYLD